ncbi:sensor histidine kinase [Cellulophaga baltica]|uniref:sensor histidine kinase n=1 Tax=Cellulophaga TaxID=104264 RepID=UPI001C06DBA3|nr:MULTISPECIES: sensor histidine kinase [Cellulophaga]MBU2997872.1 sensor histidine kinase [Cellulophaga baltica]MDO6769273.1 sensor histidine kinase [Cellulophaga sp. 1_MG-2023]
MENNTIVKELTEKNKYLEDLLLIITHDLRAPVVNIETLFKILEKQESVSKEGKPLFNKCSNQLALMSSKLRSIQQVVSLKSYAKKNTEQIFFADIIETIRNEYAREIDESKALITADYTALPSVVYDPIQYATIFCNLMSNALKYRHPNRIPEINILAKSENGNPVIKIKDNGLGFKITENSNSVFGLFKRMHDHVDGLGVGLHLVHSIITQNGGSITVKSEVDKGTEFKIRL